MYASGTHSHGREMHIVLEKYDIVVFVVVAQAILFY